MWDIQNGWITWSEKKDFFLSCPSCTYPRIHISFMSCVTVPLKKVRVTTRGQTRVPSSLYHLPVTCSICLMKNMQPRQVHTDISPKVLFHFPLICVLMSKGLNLCFYNHWCISLPLIWLTIFRLPAQHSCNNKFHGYTAQWVNISFVQILLPASFFPPPLSYRGAAAPGVW